jgi:hypothetical protein
MELETPIDQNPSEPTGQRPGPLQGLSFAVSLVAHTAFLIYLSTIPPCPDRACERARSLDSRIAREMLATFPAGEVEPPVLLERGPESHPGRSCRGHNGFLSKRGRPVEPRTHVVHYIPLEHPVMRRELATTGRLRGDISILDNPASSEPFILHAIQHVDPEAALDALVGDQQRPIF